MRLQTTLETVRCQFIWIRNHAFFARLLEQVRTKMGIVKFGEGVFTTSVKTPASLLERGSPSIVATMLCPFLEAMKGQLRNKKGDGRQTKVHESCMDGRRFKNVA